MHKLAVLVKVHFIGRVRVFAAVLILGVLSFGNSVSAEILIQKTPDRGFQPRLNVDNNGDVHLLYFKKRLSVPGAREGSLYYQQYLVSEKRFGLSIKVSSEAYNLQTFSIARASMAVGGDGRIHVVWYLPRAGQYFYSRSNSDRTQFEPQRPVVTQFAEGIDAQFAEGIDAGADIAAIGSSVAIVWGAGNLSREYERTVYGRLSTDSGATFSDEIRMGNPDLGACACCALATNYADENALSVAYRSAIDGVGRHMQLLSLQITAAELQGGSYAAVGALQEWELSACPLSTNDIAEDADTEQWLVFETAGRIVQLKLDGQGQATEVAEPFIETRQKNPAMSINERDERLIVWGEAISHSKGGRLNMRLFDENGVLKDDQFVEEVTIPNYSFPATAALPDGNFLVLY